MTPVASLSPALPEADPRDPRQSAADPSGTSHIPALDGLRGVAVVLVILHHFTLYTGFKPGILVDTVFYHLTIMGWSGVDLFFVLSGFLITRILYESKGSGSFFRHFYIRRCLRIFPLYFGVLIVYFLVLPFFMTSNEPFQLLVADQGWYWTYTINLKFALDGWPPFEALGHFWSLAVEEQFYFAWPFAVFVLGRRSLIRLCIGCIVVALVVRVALAWDQQDVAAYVLTPARMDTLSVGALVALLGIEPPGLIRWRRWAWLVAGGTGALLATVFFWRHGLPLEDPLVFTIGLSLLSYFFGAVLILTITAPWRSRTARVLSSKSLTSLGRYSYGVYVLHHPLVVLLGPAVPTAGTFTVWGSQLLVQAVFVLVAGGASLALAMISWHFYESPFLRLKKKFPYVPPAPSLAEVERTA